jgi:hypothetical protein
MSALEEAIAEACADPSMIVGLRRDGESLSDWCARAVLYVLEIRGIWPLRAIFPAPQDPPAQDPPAQAIWKPQKINHGQWQGIREIREFHVTRHFFDTAIREENGIQERVAVIFGSRSACQSRCDQLNRRQRIGSATMPELNPRCSCRTIEQIQPRPSCEIHGMPQVRGH